MSSISASANNPGTTRRTRLAQTCRLIILTAAWLACCLLTSDALASGPAPEQACPRAAAGATLQDPPELRSHNGVLELTLHFKYQPTLIGQGPSRYCYVTDDGMESPTLRVRQGDQLIIHFHNDLPRPPQSNTQLSAARDQEQDCNGGAMNAFVTNLHFHGTTVSPTCHQDEVIRTIIPAGTEFDYRVTIPRDEPPGLYWYHPHPHGYSERQVQGGASGALIVEGLENVDPWLARLPQRVIVLRDQSLSNLRVPGPATPAWDISVNYVPVLYPQYEPAMIEAEASQEELWRVLNAGADTIFNLQVVAGSVAQAMKMVAIDGVPTPADAEPQTSILLPPGARAEFVVKTPKPGEQAQLVTTDWDTGPEGDRDPTRPIANIVVAPNHSNGVAAPGAHLDSAVNSWRSLMDQAPIVRRKLYFSQLTPNPAEGDTSVFYFITVSGQAPAAYRMGQPPNIVVHDGDVEDWTVENRSPEDHVFHIHQIHFRVLEVDGKPVHDNALRDTIDLPYWSGSGPYPSVKLRMDFRDPNIVGTFLYHCHILKHEDMGMMGVIQVLPPGVPTLTRLHGPTRIGIASLATIVATVASKAPNPASPGGTVQFTMDGIQTGQPVPVVDGKATLTRSFENPGEHVITAAYAGDTTYDVSAAPPLKLRVVE